MSEINQNLRKLIGNDIIVYDYKAADGEFTSALVWLMYKIYREHRDILGVPKDAQLTRFLIPRDVFFNNIGEIKVMANLGIKIQYYTADYAKQWDEAGASLAYLPNRDHNLIIGWDDKNNQGLAGSC